MYLILWFAMQTVVDALIGQISDVAAPGSEICFDVLHRDVLEGRTKAYGFKTGSKVRTLLPMLMDKYCTGVTLGKPFCWHHTWGTSLAKKS